MITLIVTCLRRSSCLSDEMLSLKPSTAYTRKTDFQMLVLYGRRACWQNRPAVAFLQRQANFVLHRRTEKRCRQPSLFLTSYLEVLWGSARKIRIPIMGHLRWATSPTTARKTSERSFVFDEFPYAAMANPSLPSTLQIAIDHSFKSTNLMLALCGSNEGFMESEVLGYKSPLYGRRTSQIRLKPFDYRDSARLLAGHTVRRASNLLRSVWRHALLPRANRQIPDVCGKCTTPHVRHLRNLVRRTANAHKTGTSRARNIHFRARRNRVGRDQPQANRRACWHRSSNSEQLPCRPHAARSGDTRGALR